MAKCTPSIIASLLLLCLAGTALGQTTTIRGAGKGSSTPQPVTSTPVDANHTGVDVNIVGGGGSGGTASNFGAAFPATGTAIGLSDGVNMVPGLVDGSGYFEMNCKVGCSGSSFADNAAFTFGTTAIGLSGFVVDDTATNAVTENSAGLARMNANRIPYVMPTGNTGTALFPAAFASADNLAAQTATFIHGGLMAWDSGGSNWDRLLTTSGALNVNVQNASLAVTGTFFQATQPVSGTVTVTDGAGALNVIVDSGTSIVTQATGTNLHMVCDSGCTPGGSFADNAAFTFGTTAINTMGAVVDDTATNTVTENSAGAPRMNTNRILYTMPTNSTGTALALALDASVDGLEGGIGAAADAAATVGSTGSLNAKERLMTSQLDAIQTAVQLIDNAVSGAGYNITQFGGTNVVTGVGASGAGIPRVTVANDSNILATQSGTWNIGTVTTLTGITNALPTGSNTIGAITGSVADNSANSSLKLPVLNSRANASAPSWTEGNQVPLSVDLVGNLRVNSTGGGAADGTTFTENSTTFSAAGGLYNDAIVSLTSGKEYAARITPYRALYTTELGTDGLERGTRTNPVNVSMTNFGAIVQQSSLLDPRNQANTVQITTMDAMGNLRAISQITDGQHYAALRGPEGSQATDYGMVVHNSVAPSIQCPYVFPVNQTANTQLVTNPGGRWLHVCGFQVVSAGAQNVSLVEGTGATCATASKGLYGGTTASVAFAANGGGGIFSDRIVMPMQVPGDNLCLMQSAANNVSGTLSYGIY
jgi:hypothetical protein